MKTKVVYVLTSSSQDCYLEQCYVSISSLKHHQPDAKACIVCDSMTAKGFSEGVRKKMSAVADEIVSIDLDPNISAMKRSRILKTGLRSYIEGDFIFIDTDTVITAPISEVDSIDASISAVTDCHAVSLSKNPFKEMIMKHAAQIQNALDAEAPYFNSGVLLVKDNEDAKRFYGQWSSGYNEGTKNGVFMDQPSFAKAQASSGISVNPLSGIWNCQARFGLRYLSQAKVLHYLWTTRAESPFILGNRAIWDKIKETGEIPAEVEKIFDDPFCGFQELTYLASTKETQYFNTRTHKCAYKWYCGSKSNFKLISLAVKCLDAFGKLLKKA